MTKYKLVKSEVLEELNESVNQLIQEGWCLYGTHTATQRVNYKLVFAQAMTRGYTQGGGINE